MAASGHTQIKTYLRYLNKDQRPAREAGKALEEFRRQKPVDSQDTEPPENSQKDSQDEWVN